MNELNNIINGCIKNDRESQKRLFEMYGSKMLGVCSRYCKNREDAKDAMQDGFVKIFTKMNTFKGESKLETWMTRIMVYTAIDTFKKNTKMFTFDPSSALLKEEGVEMELEYFQETSLKDKLMACLDELPLGYKTIFCLYVIDGFTHKEIAEELGISSGTSKSQLARARKLLQKIVKEKTGIEQGAQTY